MVPAEFFFKVERRGIGRSVNTVFYYILIFFLSRRNYKWK